MIVLDARVLIAHLDAHDDHHARAETLLSAAAEDEFAVSPITLAEVLVGPTRAGQLDRVIAALAILEVTTIPLEPDAPVRLALLRSGTGLKMPDCCVLLAAETRGAAIATFDDRLARAGRERGFAVHEEG